MRQLRADVSHRIRHRGPSIFTAWWLRASLGVGFAVIVGLVVGPSVAGWFGADLPRSVLRLSPWDAAERSRTGSPRPATARRRAGTPPDWPRRPRPRARCPV